MPKDSSQDSEEDDGTALIKVNDAFGLGKAAHSPAALEIVRAFFRPLQTYLSGKAARRVMVDQAKGEIEVATIEDQNKDLLIRTGRRIAATETAKQLNLEAVVEKAVEHANGGTEAAARSVDDDWMLRFMEGAQYASAENVRTIWAKILASEARSEKEPIAAATLSLLGNMDSRLAETLETYLQHLQAYGAFPWMGTARFPDIDRASMAMLEEIGFLRDVSNTKYRFRQFDLRYSDAIGILQHGELAPTRRGHQIIMAVYEHHSFPPIDEEKKAEQLVSVVHGLMNTATQGVELSFRNADKIDVASVSLPKITVRIPAPPGSIKRSLIDQVMETGVTLNKLQARVLLAIEHQYPGFNVKRLV